MVLDDGEGTMTFEDSGMEVEFSGLTGLDSLVGLFSRASVELAVTLRFEAGQVENPSELETLDLEHPLPLTRLLLW